MHLKDQETSPTGANFLPSPDEIKLIFDSIAGPKNESIKVQQLVDRIGIDGIQLSDVRLEKILSKYVENGKVKKNESLDYRQFKALLEKQTSSIVTKSLFNKLAVPDFKEFTRDIESFYEKTRKLTGGKCKDESVKDKYGIAVCTIDGQKFHIGDKVEKFPLQSVCKPINYAIALHENGEKKVHQHVGREPSGRGYNGIILNQENLPHNPLINAGALVTCSLIKPEKSSAQRHLHVMETWKKLCGNSALDFDEKDVEINGDGNHRNMALSYYMLEKGSFPEKTDIYKNIDFYNRCCHIKVNVDQLAMAGATLANGGFCPTTGKQLFNSNDIRDCLSLMLSCGMYDYSGEFAFLVGLPAKSGVSGALMLVIPGLMSIAIYSPPIDEMGNTVRGVAFCKELVAHYNFHHYDHIVYDSNRKKNLDENDE